MRLARLSSLPLALLAAGLLVSGSAEAVIIDLEASMDCAQANAGVGTCGGGGTGTGSATITFNTDTNLLSWNVTWSGLSAAATLAHFHGPALPNQNAGVQVGIGVPSPQIGAAVITGAQASDLLNELWYINVHTSNFPGGEIRGQVLVVPEPATAVLMTAFLVGAVALGRRRAV